MRGSIIVGTAAGIGRTAAVVIKNLLRFKQAHTHTLSNPPSVLSDAHIGLCSSTVHRRSKTCVKVKTTVGVTSSRRVVPLSTTSAIAATRNRLAKSKSVLC